MENNQQSFVYSSNVIEFMTVAVRTCVFLEQEIENESRESLVSKLLGLLPVLYVKARLVPAAEPSDDGFLEQFCTEEQYERVRSAVAEKLGDDDVYLSLPVENGRYDDICATRSISEDVADIYQALKDMAHNYQLHDEEIMREAVADCLYSFKDGWGMKLLDAVHALHIIEW